MERGLHGNVQHLSHKVGIQFILQPLRLLLLLLPPVLLPRAGQQMFLLPCCSTQTERTGERTGLVAHVLLCKGAQGDTLQDVAEPWRFTKGFEGAKPLKNICSLILFVSGQSFSLFFCEFHLFRFHYAGAAFPRLLLHERRAPFPTHSSS